MRAIQAVFIATVVFGLVSLTRLPGGNETVATGAAQNKKLLFHFAGQNAANTLDIWTSPGETTFFFKAKLAVDADSSPRAYHPKPDDRLGLDDLANAGGNGKWWAIHTDKNGVPTIQSAKDPAPGFYVSMTALYDKNRGGADPKRYVDSEEIPYIVLPGNVIKKTGARLGDFAVAINNGTAVPAILADTGPKGLIGEGSIRLARSLGIDHNPRTGGTTKRAVIYVVFPKSGAGQGKLRTLAEIETEGKRLFENWGGLKRLEAVIKEGL